MFLFFKNLFHLGSYPPTSYSKTRPFLSRPFKPFSVYIQESRHFIFVQTPSIRQPYQTDHKPRYGVPNVWSMERCRKEENRFVP